MFLIPSLMNSQGIVGILPAQNPLWKSGAEGEFDAVFKGLIGSVDTAASNAHIVDSHLFGSKWALFESQSLSGNNMFYFLKDKFFTSDVYNGCKTDNEKGENILSETWETSGINLTNFILSVLQCGKINQQDEPITSQDGLSPQGADNGMAALVSNKDWRTDFLADLLRTLQVLFQNIMASGGMTNGEDPSISGYSTNASVSGETFFDSCINQLQSETMEAQEKGLKDLMGEFFLEGKDDVLHEKIIKKIEGLIKAAETGNTAITENVSEGLHQLAVEEGTLEKFEKLIEKLLKSTQTQPSNGGSAHEQEKNEFLKGIIEKAIAEKDAFRFLKTNAVTSSDTSAALTCEESGAFLETLKNLKNLISLSRAFGAVIKTENKPVDNLIVQENVKAQVVKKYGKTALSRSDFSLPADGMTHVVSSQDSSKVVSAERINPFILVQEVAEKIRLSLKKPETVVKMELHPPALGKIHMNLSVRDNQLRAMLIAESPQVKHILEANLDQLRTSLANHQIQVEKFSVSVGQGNGSAGFFIGGRNENRENCQNQLDETTQAQADVLSQPLNREVTLHNGKVDIFI